MNVVSKVAGEKEETTMNTEACYTRTMNPGYLKALNVQNALGYRCSGWLEYERALGKHTTTKAYVFARACTDKQGYIGMQMLLAILGEAIPSETA